ncbi:hypothetical protein QDA04_gp73 [Microbacterium phage Megan]|uniref:Uncharacterized protein n=1 Tax=Microbacterium phage Megan TaxID=2656551 RepID=A0A649VM20_9CAUD|nr:hypothetical protein QDA04_gp73 [Microbacterium phage Megan]QGJ92743.1 hypothetical protein PBI_MEGAN_73 [Microbacterium phage Megan]
MKCDAPLQDGITCQREEGHDGPHMFEGELPPSIAQMVGAIMNDAERATERANRAYRRYRVLGFFQIGTCLIWLGVAISAVLR